ncbi:hypothetical protein BJX64DRAFT_286715 [Aspergillus heterothallicus]
MSSSQGTSGGCSLNVIISSDEIHAHDTGTVKSTVTPQQQPSTGQFPSRPQIPQERRPMPKPPRARVEKATGNPLFEFESEGHGTVSRADSELAALAEFRFRNEIIYQSFGGQIHHFNWLGHPVFRSSSTPPEISLWCLVARPKSTLRDTPTGFLKKATLNNAWVWVDPVSIRVDKGVYLPQDGQGLLRFAKGRTQKMYTLHGVWKYGPEKDQILIDTGDTTDYMDPKRRVGNGFIEGTSIRTRDERIQYERLVSAVALQDLKKSKNARVKRPSPLRQSMTPMELEGKYLTLDILSKQEALKLKLPQMLSKQTPATSNHSYGYDHGTFNIATNTPNTDVDQWASQPFQESLYHDHLEPILEGDITLALLFGDLCPAASTRAFTDPVDPSSPSISNGDYDALFDDSMEIDL